MINALQQLEASLANAEAELAHAADCLAQSEDQLAMRGESRVAMPALKPRMVTMGTQTDNSDSNVTVRVCAHLPASLPHMREHEGCSGDGTRSHCRCRGLRKTGENRSPKAAVCSGASCPMLPTRTCPLDSCDRADHRNSADRNTSLIVPPASIRLCAVAAVPTVL